MAQPTYNARAIVLRKTKLGESDLIVTLLVEDGSQVRAVAKGARKPSSSFAVRLELYSVVDVLLARGRNLDIVKEVRLTQSNDRVRLDMEHAAGAAPIAELLDRVTQMGLENPHLFALTQVALSSLGKADTSRVPMICAAHLLKTLAFVGLRPSFDRCVGCGNPLPIVQTSRVAFSFTEGGVVCGSCRGDIATIDLSADVLALSRTLLASTFADIEAMEVALPTSFGVLRFCQQWVREHVNANLKSLDFLFTCGLF